MVVTNTIATTSTVTSSHTILGSVTSKGPHLKYVMLLGSLYSKGPDSKNYKNRQAMWFPHRKTRFLFIEFTIKFEISPVMCLQMSVKVFIVNDELN